MAPSRNRAERVVFMAFLGESSTRIARRVLASSSYDECSAPGSSPDEIGGARLEMRYVVAQRRAQPTADAVTGDRVTHRPGRPRTRRAAAPDPTPRRRFSPRDSRSAGAGRGPAPETTIDHGRARSGGEVRAALGATAANHRAARAIAHPKSETVLLLPFPVVRLVCAFHPWPPRTPGPRRGPGAGARQLLSTRAKWTHESTGSS